MNRRQFTISAIAASILGFVRPELGVASVNVIPVPDWLEMWIPYIKVVAKKPPYSLPNEEQKERFSKEIAAVEKYQEDFGRIIELATSDHEASDWQKSNPPPSREYEELIGMENAIAFYEEQRARIHNMPMRYSDEDSILEQESISAWEAVWGNTFWVPAKTLSIR